MRLLSGLCRSTPLKTLVHTLLGELYKDTNFDFCAKILATAHAFAAGMGNPLVALLSGTVLAHVFGAATAEEQAAKQTVANERHREQLALYMSVP